MKCWNVDGDFGFTGFDMPSITLSSILILVESSFSRFFFQASELLLMLLVGGLSLAATQDIKSEKHMELLGERCSDI